MIDQIKTLFPYAVVAVVLGMSAVGHSTPMACASVLGMGFILTNNLIEKIRLDKGQKVTIPDEVRRQLQDLAVRTTTLEYGVKQRGF